MKKYIIFVIILIVFTINIYPAFEFIPGNVKAKSMQYTTTSIIMGIDNTLINPASIVGVNNIDMNISYENLFFFTHTFAAAIGYSSDYGAIGAKYSEFFVLGDYTDTDSLISENTRLHTERTASLTYGINIDDIFNFGVSANLMYLSQLNSNSSFTPTFDFGIIGTVYERWNIGLAVLNATDQYIIGGIDQYRYYFDRTVSAGVSFTPYDNLITSFDISKSAENPTSYGGGIIYEIIENLFIIRAGARSFPIEYGAGFEIILEKFSIDYGYTANQYIGEQHHIQLNYIF